jgi:hypothetical protein
MLHGIWDYADHNQAGLWPKKGSCLRDEMVMPRIRRVSVGDFTRCHAYFASANSVGVLPVTCRNACEKAGTLA